MKMAKLQECFIQSCRNEIYQFLLSAKKDIYYDNSLHEDISIS